MNKITVQITVEHLQGLVQNVIYINSIVIYLKIAYLPKPLSFSTPQEAVWVNHLAVLEAQKLRDTSWSYKLISYHKND